MKQTAKIIFMIRPAGFGFNAETAENNVFQGEVSLSQTEVQTKALEEFDAFVTELRSKEIEVMVMEDTPLPQKPDAVFPNNWFCTLPDGTVATFPMFAPNRRMEVRSDLIQMLKDRFVVSSVEDWTSYEEDNLFLEGTGSMIIDTANKIVYACLSPRTNPAVLQQFAEAHHYKTVVFSATDENGTDVYHTNVIMHLGAGYAVLCTSSIRKEEEKQTVIQSLTSTGHSIIDISLPQVHRYAGNMLQVENTKGKLFTIISRQAFDSLSDDQKKMISEHSELLPISIPTIETVGGGSVRCMMAEIFLEKKHNA